MLDNRSISPTLHGTFSQPIDAADLSRASSRYQLDDIVGKREHQQHASFGLGNTARPHIKQGILVELTDRGSMTTLHIVCINFELRFRVHFGERRCTQILITLIGFGFLSPVSDQYASAERPRAESFNTYLNNSLLWQ